MFQLAICVHEDAGAVLFLLRVVFSDASNPSWNTNRHVFMTAYDWENYRYIYFAKIMPLNKFLVHSTVDDSFLDSLKKGLQLLPPESGSALGPNISINNSSNFCFGYFHQTRKSYSSVSFWHYLKLQLNYLKKNWISYLWEVGVLNAMDFFFGWFIQIKMVESLLMESKRAWQWV